jgi:hypothetical protein
MRLISQNFSKFREKSKLDLELMLELTRNSEQHDLFICPFFGRIVVLWYPAGVNVAFILGVGYVAVSKMSVYKYPKELGCDQKGTYENTTPSGKLLPGFRAVMTLTVNAER